MRKSLACILIHSILCKAVYEFLYLTGSKIIQTYMSYLLVNTLNVLWEMNYSYIL